MNILITLGKFVGTYFLDKLVGWFRNYLLLKIRRKNIEELAKKQAEELKKAQTSEEIDKATRNALDGF